MSAKLSNTQVDKLGERLKKGAHSEDDLRMLDEYRRTFGEAYEIVVRTVRGQLQDPTGRSGKSTQSIVDKLRRESIRLSQMQDIAGCRVVVANVIEQDRAVSVLTKAFPGVHIDDRRDKPSHGYRAVHLIQVVAGRSIEIQLRTTLQHMWAEVSEKVSDIVDAKLKYGVGPDNWRTILVWYSKTVAKCEGIDRMLSDAITGKNTLGWGVLAGPPAPDEPDHTQQFPRTLDDWKRDQQQLRESLVDSFNSLISALDKLRPAKEKP